MKLQPIESNGIVIGYFYNCPGCELGHALYISSRNDSPTRSIWEFNGSLTHPTFRPSVLSEYRYTVDPGMSRSRCHSYVTDGKITYLEDCTHKLAGQTIDIPDIEE